MIKGDLSRGKFLTMPLIEKIITSLENHVDELHRDRHPFLMLRPVGFGLEWVLKQGGNGCRPIKIPAAILMVKNPAPLTEDKNKNKPKASPSSANAGGGQHGATVKPAAPPASYASTQAAALDKKKQESCPAPPPFDMMDLPDAMDAMGFKYSAKFARKWFEGKAHVIEDEKKGQPAIIQPAEFVDKDTLKLDWILKFGTVRERYAHLLATGLKPSAEENIYNSPAQNMLKKRLGGFMGQHNNYFSGTLDTLTECGNDIQVLHQRFQFQHVLASMLHVLGGIPQIAENKVRGGAVTNDLAGALGNFNIYAAIATAKISTTQYMVYDKQPWQSCRRTKVEVTHIWVYAKDSYSFNDKFSASQYLGHWNRRGVIVAYDAFAAQQTSSFLAETISPNLAYEDANEPRPYLPPVPAQLDKPVDTGSSMKEKEVFYPVRNRDFRNWRDLKKRGGDLMIFSNFEKVKLPTSMVIDLGEICREYKR